MYLVKSLSSDQRPDGSKGKSPPGRSPGQPAGQDDESPAFGVAASLSTSLGPPQRPMSLPLSRSGPRSWMDGVLCPSDGNCGQRNIQRQGRELSLKPRPDGPSIFQIPIYHISDLVGRKANGHRNTEKEINSLSFCCVLIPHRKSIWSQIRKFYCITSKTDSQSEKSFYCLFICFMQSIPLPHGPFPMPPEGFLMLT